MKISDGHNLCYFDRNFKPGCVIYRYCSFITPRPKYKYLFVCCVTPLLLFPINSEITNYIKKNNLNCYKHLFENMNYRKFDVIIKLNKFNPILKTVRNFFVCEI